ncbi:MAG: hypothetical protein ABIR38_04560 [Chthoniobacterales bacterium]
MTHGIPASSDIYEDEYGRWISGYAPSSTAPGVPVPIVEADARVSRYLERPRAELLLGFAIGATLF